MKLKHKEFIIGIILGGLLFGSISIFADDVFDISPNPFKITVDGAEKSIEGYNINGSSYFKLRDIGEQVGFNVDFKENTIMIERTNGTSSETSENEELSSKQDNNIETINIDGFQDTIKISGTLYYYFNDINTNNMLTNTVLMPVQQDDESWALNLCKKDTTEILIEDVPNVFCSEHMHVSETYLQEVILPLDESLSE